MSCVTAPPRSDRGGRRQAGFLQIFLKDPTFGSLTTQETLESSDSSVLKNQYSWESLDDIEARFHYLSKEERAEKVQLEVASALKKSKHPTRKGEFIYKLWRARSETEVSASNKARKLSLEAEVASDAAEILASAMSKEVAGMGSSSSKALMMDPAAHLAVEDEPQVQPKKKAATPRTEKVATPSAQLKKVERETVALATKLATAKAFLDGVDPKMASDTELLQGLADHYERAMAMVAEVTNMKINSGFTKEAVEQLASQAKDLNLSCAIHLKQSTIRMKVAKSIKK